MNGVRLEIDRSLGLHEIVKSDAELWGEIPHARPTRLARLHDNVWRILVVCPDQSASALCEGNNPLSRFQVPAQNNGRNADSGKGATVIRQLYVASLPLVFIFRQLIVRRGREGLPVGHHFCRILKLAAQKTREVLV